MDMENLTSADLTINNWDDSDVPVQVQRDRRPSTSATGSTSSSATPTACVSMMRGQIATAQPALPRVRPADPPGQRAGRDAAAARRQAAGGRGEALPRTSDWEIAERVAERNGLQPEVTERGARARAGRPENQDDASFLMERAKRIDFDFFILTDPDSGEDTLYFVPPDRRPRRPADPGLRVRLGREPDRVHPGPDPVPAGRARSPCAAGTRAPRSRSTATADRNDLPARRAAAPRARRPRPGSAGAASRRSWSTRPSSASRRPTSCAISPARERAYEFITGSGRVIGLPDLRPGDNLRAAGLGDRFSGTYYVKKVEHTLGGSGFITQFDVRRTYDPGVPGRRSDMSQPNAQFPTTDRRFYGVPPRSPVRGRSGGPRQGGAGQAALPLVRPDDGHRRPAASPSCTPATATARSGAPRRATRCWSRSSTATCACRSCSAASTTARTSRPSRPTRTPTRRSWSPRAGTGSSSTTRPTRSPSPPSRAPASSWTATSGNVTISADAKLTLKARDIELRADGGDVTVSGKTIRLN